MRSALTTDKRGTRFASDVVLLGPLVRDRVMVFQRRYVVWDVMPGIGVEVV